MAGAGSPVVRGSLTYYVLPTQEKAQGFIEGARALGGHLVSFTPRRRSLEDIFLTETNR